MKIKKYVYPVLVNGPLLILIGALCIKLAAVFPKLPERIPLHFDWNGTPNGWGSPRKLIFAILTTLIIWGSSVVISFLWASEEGEKKTFNWLAPVMTVPVAFLTAVVWTFLNYASIGHSNFTVPWADVSAICIGAVGLTALAEWFRPFVPGNRHAYQDQMEHYLPQVQARLQNAGWDGKVAYWESQDPLMARIGIVILIMFLIISTLWSPFQVLIILPIIALYGGIRVWINADWVLIKLGIFGIPLRRIKRSDIARVKVHEFSPLRDFGGWGIRVGRGGMTGFFYRGNVGVLIEERRGRKTLIGSDNPARLAAVVAADLPSNQKL